MDNFEEREKKNESYNEGYQKGNSQTIIGNNAIEWKPKTIPAILYSLSAEQHSEVKNEEIVPKTITKFSEKFYELYYCAVFNTISNRLRDQ